MAAEISRAYWSKARGWGSLIRWPWPQFGLSRLSDWWETRTKAFVLLCLPDGAVRGYWGGWPVYPPGLQGVWFPMFINPYGDTFPEDGTTAEELQNPMHEACVSYDGINYDTKSWAVLAFRNALWEILGGKRNVESRVGWEVPGRCETAACQRSGRPL